MSPCFRLLATLLLFCFSLSCFANGLINQCWKKATSHPDVYTCLAKKVKAQQNILDQTYNQAKISIESLAEANPALAKRLIAELTNSRKNFETYQNIQCQLAADAAAGGSGTGDMEAGCMIDLAKSQTALLINYIGAGS